MQWRDRQGSSNIRTGGRGVRGGAAIGGGGILIGLIVLLLTGNPFAALNAGLGAGGLAPSRVEQQQIQFSQQEQQLYDFSAVVLKDTEDTWSKLLPQYGENYQPAKMVVFQDAVKSGCGIAESGMGPFYCGADQTVYMDLSFYDTLVQKFQASKNQYILSYVIAHEIGHHVQQQLGILDQVNQERAKAGTRAANEFTIRLEVMADYLAGVVTRFQQDKGYLEAGDVDAAIKTAWSIGDDTIQKRAQGYATPESFTHGTREQRSRWFKMGYQAGDLSQFNSFDYDRYPSAADL